MQAQPDQDFHDSQSGASAAPKTSGQQHVQMSRFELEQYVLQGRPTGLLFRSVATLKGISTDSIARASGIPMQLIEAIFNDHGAASIKKGAIKRVAQVLGIDLSVMRLAPGQVHIFQLDRVKSRAGSEAFRQAMRGVGLLLRNARAGELQIGTGLQAFMWRKRIHVMAHEDISAVFIGKGSKLFDLSFVPSAAWVRKERSDSMVPVTNSELISALVSQNLTCGEFDELFLGAEALTWEDVRVASRVNGVSKADLMKFIESRADEADANEEETEKAAAIQGRPQLRLVDLSESEPRAACGGM
ncbi:transcriptional regulator with XRE-family HTH domain [Roseateles asaccharophilus]|uniref:hypothetical protein n=1 Tax=Roseateles asaccharophilus TaxID=582607 RepID=UPI003832E712